MEDSLKRLEKLTNEEFRIAATQVLRTSHVVNKRAAGVDDHVKAIDDKAGVVIDGAPSSLISQQRNIINFNVSRRKRDKGSYTTSRRRNGSSEKSVIFFLR